MDAISPHSPTQYIDLTARQVINVHSAPLPPGGALMRWTEREVRVAPAMPEHSGFASIDDAVDAARMLSRGSLPGLAVVPVEDGFGIAKLRTYSATLQSVTSEPGQAPHTEVIASSNVPFAIGNLRFGSMTHGLPLVGDAPVQAIVDGSQILRTAPGSRPGQDVWTLHRS